MFLIEILKFLLTAVIIALPAIILFIGLIVVVIYMILKKEIHDWWISRLKKRGERG